MRTRAAVALMAVMGFIHAAPCRAQAQTGTISGVVTAKTTGEPLPGAFVEVVGTRIAQTTNENGRFLLLNVPAGTYRLKVSFLGYADATQANVVVQAGQAASVTVALESSVLSLAEVVVTGVSEATTGLKAPFTVGRVSAENIKAVPTTGSAVTAIQGKVAGVQMVRSSGMPGAGSNIQLRTPTSIQGSTSPMFVVDGVILASEIGGTTVDLESLDIESIEIVKGAAAASLYGSRAASGVIAITTSRGKNLALDQTRITTRSEFGTSQTPKMISMTNSHQYLQDEQGQWVDADGNVVPRSLRVLTPTGMQDQPYRTQAFDNLGRFFRPAQFMQNSVNLTHRAANTNFLVSATRYNERGTLQTNDGFTRDNFRVNLDHRLRSDFQLSVSAGHSRYNRDLIYQGSSGEGGIFWDLLMFPRDVDIGVRDADGNYLQQPDSMVLVTNPLWYEESREYYEKRARTIASVDARYNPFSWFSLTGTLGYDRSDRSIHAYTPKGTSTSLTSENESNGFLQKDGEIGDVLNASLQGNLTRHFGNLSTRTVGRALIERESNEFVRATGSDFYVNDVPRLNAAASRTVSSELRDIRATGYMIEETLDYAGRYLLTALARRDGSSLFGPNERWQNYYRVGGAWFLSEESWWGIEPLTQFKLRFSQGTAGSRPNFAWQYETWSVSNTGAVSKNTLGNRNLKPEHTTERELGLDMIVNDRYSLQLTYASQVTRDQIIQLTLPGVYGYPSQRFNTGVQSGETYEATLEAQLVNQPGLTWTMTAVADRSDSRIDEWNRACFISTLRNVCEGSSLTDMWGERHVTSLDEIRARHPDAAQQFQVNDDGYVVWVGEGADWRQGLERDLWGTSERIDGEVYTWGIPIVERDSLGFPTLSKIGSSRPDVNFGLLNNVFWRGFAIHAQLHAQLGGHTYNATKQRLYQHYQHGDVDQAGKAPETKKPLAYYATVYNRMNPTQHFVEDGSYLKLRAIGVQYRINQDQLNRVGIGGLARGINVGANLRNVFTMTKYSGFDPEVGSVLQRRDYFNYPNARQLTLTAEITF